MSRLPALKADEVIRKLRRAGFQVDHITGAHYIMRRSDGRQTVVLYHAGRDVKRDVLCSVIRQAGLTVGEFLDL